ncbi:MAG: response regulator, partial [Gemmatimonadaceae bacterium]|nr:response regulator [Gemmatimonadaceae bacterium]
MTPPVMHVLLVEDNPGDAGLMRRFLARDSGYLFDVETVVRLSAAVARVEGPGVDVIVLDLTLPDSGGIATFEAMHRAAPL